MPAFHYMLSKVRLQYGFEEGTVIRITLKVRQSASQFIVFSTLTGLPAFAQQPFVPAPHRAVPLEVPLPVKHSIPATPRSMVGGFWRTDANYKSVLYLRNAVAGSPITATPVLYSLMIRATG
jgi:hypothetical protein